MVLIYIWKIKVYLCMRTCASDLFVCAYIYIYGSVTWLLQQFLPQPYDLRCQLRHSAIFLILTRCSQPLQAPSIRLQLLRVLCELTHSVLYLPQSLLLLVGEALASLELLRQHLVRLVRDHEVRRGPVLAAQSV